MSIAPSSEIPGLYTPHFLRMEAGWEQVAKGLSRIVLGHFILVGGPLLGLGMVCLSLMNTTPANHPLNPVYLWLVTAGVGALALIGIWGYGMIFVGQWRCLLNVPERHGARWLLFSSMTCVFTGPALNVVSLVSGVERYPDVFSRPADFKYLEFTPMGGCVQLAGGVFTLAGFILFMLFLRAVVCCFEDRPRVLHANVYLGFVGLVLVGSLLAWHFSPEMLRHFEGLLLVIGGWLAAYFWYLFLILSVRQGISTGLNELRSPLDL